METAKYKKIITASFVLLTILLLPNLAMAVDDLPLVPDAPIDGGLSLLVAAGVGYGAKKLKEKRAKSSIKN